jgi:hypothetical protein
LGALQQDVLFLEADSQEPAVVAGAKGA